MQDFFPQQYIFLEKCWLSRSLPTKTHYYQKPHLTATLDRSKEGVVTFRILMLHFGLATQKVLKRSINEAKAAKMTKGVKGSNDQM